MLNLCLLRVNIFLQHTAKQEDVIIIAFPSFNTVLLCDQFIGIHFLTILRLFLALI